MPKLLHNHRELMHGRNINIKINACILEERTTFLSYVDVSRLCNVINEFTDLNIYFLTNGIAFPLSYSERAIKQR